MFREEPRAKRGARPPTSPLANNVPVLFWERRLMESSKEVCTRRPLTRVPQLVITLILVGSPDSEARARGQHGKGSGPSRPASQCAICGQSSSGIETVCKSPYDEVIGRWGLHG